MTLIIWQLTINTVISYGVDEVLLVIRIGSFASKEIKLYQKGLEQVEEQKRLKERINRNEMELNHIKLSFIDLSNMKNFGFDKIVEQKEFLENSEIILHNLVLEIDNLQNNMRNLKNENSGYYGVAEPPNLLK